MSGVWTRSSSTAAVVDESKDADPPEEVNVASAEPSEGLEMDVCYTEIVLPPLSGDADSSEPRIWRADRGVVEAGKHFRRMLPTLLDECPDQWVYVTSDGHIEAFGSQDEAEIAALNSGLPCSEFIVRLVSVLEFADEA